jgi:hypothetical protein
VLTGTLEDWLDLEKFLKRRKIEFSSIMSKYYRNLLGVAWTVDRFQRGELANLPYERNMKSVDTLVKESGRVERHLRNVNMVLDIDLNESEVLPLHDWYVTRRKAREEEYKATLTEKLKRAIKRFLGVSYEELAPFQVLVSGDGTHITLVWDILTNSKLTEKEKSQLISIARKRGLTVDESLLVLKHSSKNRFHVQ